MKKLLHLLIFIIPLTIFSQPYITVDVTTYTHEELITDVLINSSCATIGNITSTTGTDFGSLNGIGYFENTNPDFPMDDGLIMMTANVEEAPGPNGSPQAAGDWPGDDQLFDYIQGLGIDPGLTSYNDASIMEFDFTPLNDSISFNFVFASNEYGTFQCSYSDAFAFFLENQDTGEIVNMALVPDTPGEVPISVTTIRDNTHNGGCASANEEYFSTYYGTTGLPNVQAPINFNGHTVLMQAWSYVTANTQYRMKLVIADRNDSAFNSAVFIQGGSFFLGVELGEDITIENGNAVCSTEAITIGLGSTIDPTITYQWYVYDEVLMDFVIIPGETNANLDVEESGTYQLEVTFANGCSATDEIIVEFAPQPTAGIPDDLEECDDFPNDGFTEFMLTDADAQIIDGQTDVFVMYFETLALAENGDPADELISPYTNIVADNQTVFARIEETSEFACYDVVELNLVVIPAPDIADPITDYILCDDDQNGVETFDLTSKDTEIVNGVPNVTIVYFNNFADADDNVNPILDPVNYVSAGGETIFVRVESTDTGCYSVSSFQLELYPNPGFVEPTDYILCDDEVADGFTEFDLSTKVPEISGGNPDVSISFHIDQADAEAGANALSILYTNTANPQTIWVRIRDINTGCYSTTSFDLIVNESPTVFPPDPLTYCDPDNDGFGAFTLEDANDQITGGDPDLIVSYHETEVNAVNNSLPLVSPYENIVVYNQTVYARVENPDNGCFVVVPLELQVLDSPQIVDPDPLVECDVNNNGTTIFNLTEAEPQIFANIPDPSLYTINYYQTQTDADAGVNAINPPTGYANTSNPQTIYIVVEDNGNGCQSQTTLELIVTDLPDLTFPIEESLCDVNNPGDEIEAFDLDALIPEITNGDTSINISFHESLADAQAGINPLASPYENISNAQDIWIRAEDTTSGCVVADEDMTVTLRVDPLPSPAAPEPLEVCDPDSDDFEEFDLDSTIPQIQAGEPDVSITFHETLVDAQDGVFALESPYFNIVQDEQTIYVRVENDITGCFTIVELLLVVNPTPDIPIDLEDLVVCSEDQTEIGIIFDLTEQEAAIYGDQDPGAFDLSYHVTQADAESGDNAIVTPEAYANTSNPQTIWVRLSDGTTECTKVGSFQLVVEQAPEVAALEDLEALEQCDDEVIDGFTEFDLTVMIPDITLGAPEGMEVQFYESEADAQNQENQIDPDTAYTNTVNPQNIWVRVVDGDTGCDAFTRITLRVLPNPSPNVPDPIELCDTDGTGEQVFDLTIREDQILGGEPGVSLSYYETLEDAEEGDIVNAIPDETNYTNTSNPQVIYVRVENDETGCYTIVELLLIVNTLPELTVTDYTFCEVNTDGIAVFDLNTKIDEILLTQDPEVTYTVTFHEIAGDEQIPQNAIPQADLGDYQNQSNPQTIYVRVENTDTECFVTGSFELQVLEGATATAPPAPLEVCEDEQGSGVGTFDLTQLNDGILNGQEPPEYELTYHEGFEDADAGINGIPEADQAAYESGTQSIWARVTRYDAVFDAECYEVVEIELIVNPLPVLAALQDSYRLCVDEFGNPIMEEFGATSPPVIDTGLSTPEYAFIWEINGEIQFDQTGGSITATEGGTYTVTVIDSATGCESEPVSTQVEVSSPPTEYSAGTVTGAFAGTHAIEAEADGLGSYVFSLDGGPLQAEGYWDDVTPGTHVVTIVDENGCGSVEIEVGVIDYPLFFTPNNDGYHDRWNIIGISSMPSSKIYIFDRHGKLLKQLSPLSEGWDGTYNGRELPSSDYWFRVEYREDDTDKEFRGHFTLKR